MIWSWKENAESNGVKCFIKVLCSAPNKNVRVEASLWRTPLKGKPLKGNFKGELKRRCKLARKHKKMTNISICKLCLVVLSLFIQKLHFSALNQSSSCSPCIVMYVCSLQLKCRKRLVWHIGYFHYTFQPCSWHHWRSCWAQNGSTHGYVFATFKCSFSSSSFFIFFIF